MTKKQNYLRIAGIVVCVLVLGVLVWLFIKSSPAGPAGVATTSPTSSTATSSLPPTPSSPTSPATHSASPSSVSPTAKMVVISPAANDQWISTVQHTIQWNRASGAPNGTISLVNAATGAVAGWIQQQILPTQTTFPWNTRDIFTTKAGPLKEDVTPGQYRIVLTFNSPSDPPVTGPIFSIITAAQAQIPASTVTIQGAIFSPSSLSVPQDTQLTFVNHDATGYQLLNSSNANVFVIGPSASRVFDTSSFTPGSYVFYSTSSPSLRATVTVK